MINWRNNLEIIETLEEIFPEEDLEDLTTENLKEKLLVLSNYEDLAPDWTDEQLNDILEEWKHLRES